MINLVMAERYASTHLGVIHVGLGVAILAGGPQRFPSHYDHDLPKLVVPYGLLFLVAGICMMIPKRPITTFGLALGLFGMNLLAALFLNSVMRFETSGATSWWMYFSVGSLDGVLMCLSILHWRQARLSLPPKEKSD